MARSAIGLGIAVLLGTGCSWQGTPVPVVGDLTSLEGSWEGPYSSAASGRSGTISFQLRAGTDSAFGDVLMMPVLRQDIRGGTQQGIAPRPRIAMPLRIAFVRSEGGRVSGRLDPFQDPETGERLLTMFVGTQRGNEFKGTYSTLTEGTGRMVTGEWSVKRVRP